MHCGHRTCGLDIGCGWKVVKNHLGLELFMAGIDVKFKLVQAGELSVALWTRKDVFTAAVFLLYQRDGFQNLPLFLVQCKQFLVS